MIGVISASVNENDAINVKSHDSNFPTQETINGS